MALRDVRVPQAEAAIAHLDHFADRRLLVSKVESLTSAFAARGHGPALEDRQAGIAGANVPADICARLEARGRRCGRQPLLTRKKRRSGLVSPVAKASRCTAVHASGDTHGDNTPIG